MCSNQRACSQSNHCGHTYMHTSRCIEHGHACDGHGLNHKESASCARCELQNFRSFQSPRAHWHVASYLSDRTFEFMLTPISSHHGLPNVTMHCRAGAAHGPMRHAAAMASPAARLGLTALTPIRLGTLGGASPPRVFPMRLVHGLPRRLVQT